MNEAMKRQQKFQALYKKFNDETMFLSYHDYDHPAYKEIVSMGRPIIPLLLSNLWDSWLPIMALHAILGEVPFEIAEEDHGRFDNLSEKWYAWGEENGYI